MKEESNKMEKIISLAKRRGFIFQGSEIYGGLAGTWDYGPYGVTLQHNIKEIWWNMFINNRDDMYPIDAAIIMNPKAWEASGHVAGFADQTEDGKMFNVMFKTSVGAGENAITSYLRPETAGGMFVNFKNVMDSIHPKLPFGLGQIGKAFRNEIAPRDFIFRQREFKQMEVEYFVRPNDWEISFEEWRKIMHEYAKAIGIPETHIHELEVPDNDRAHYSKRTIDFEFDYPFGRKELWGLAYRGDFDLKQHQEFSGVPLVASDEGEAPFTPHVIEPSLGVDRTVLAVLTSAYTEDEMNGETRAYLKFLPRVAPVLCAVSPLLKNKPELVEKAREVYTVLKKEFGRVMFDDNGNIGKRYRRQDEIGTPYCIVIDFETLEGKGVTVRHRDTGEQERVSEEELVTFLNN
jgi:glycyl-tRNA synthetase